MFRPALLSSLKTYTKQTFLADLFAGLTVGVVAGVIVTAGLVLYAADSVLRAWEAMTRG